MSSYKQTNSTKVKGNMIIFLTESWIIKKTVLRYYSFFNNPTKRIFEQILITEQIFSALSVYYIIFIYYTNK